MIGIFKRRKKKYPEFWETYEKTFEEELPDTLETVKFTVLDTETTGFDTYRDRILCIGALTLQNDRIKIGDSLEVYLQQENYNAETAKIHGILKRGRAQRISESEALQILLEYIGNTIIVGHHVQFDVAMINRALQRIGLPKLKNTVLDTGTLYKKTLLRSNLLKKRKAIPWTTWRINSTFPKKIGTQP